MTTPPDTKYPTNPGDAIHKTMQMGNIVAQRSIWLGNIRKNLPVVNKGLDIMPLQNLFQDIPGIVVGAGPSLEKNIDLLAEHAKSYPLFCTDRAFAMLYKKGVIPEFTVAVDAQDKVAAFFDDMPIHKTILLASVKLSRKVLDLSWMARMFFLVLDSDPQFNEAMTNLTGDRISGLPGALICGNHAYLLARHSGCNPVTFVGCDMCMDEPSKNPGEVSYESTDINGNKIYSLPGYLAGLEWIIRHMQLDIDVQSGKVKVFNSTEGGIMYADNLLESKKLQDFVAEHPGASRSLKMLIRKRLDL